MKKWWVISENVKQIFKELKSYAKSLDTTRIVTFVSNSISYGPKADVSALSDILTWNEYIGTWHGKHRDELNSYMDQIREELPSRSMMITEHGLCEPVFTGGDVRRIDEMLFHFKEWEKRSWISGVIYFSLNDYRTHMGESNEGKFRQRVHGVTDLYRQRKPSFDVYKKLSSPVSVSEEHLSDKEIKLIIGFNAFELRLCRAEGVRLNAEGDVLLSLFSLAAAMETVENRKNGLHTVPTACSHPLFPL